MKKRFKLYLSWDSVEYKDGGRIVLKGAKMSGPVLKEVAKVNSNDSINLDITGQFLVTSGSWEIAIFSWGEILNQSNELVEFKEAHIDSEQLVTFKTLSETNMLLINTEGHQEEKHMYNFVYETKVVDRDSVVYTNLDKV